MEELHDRSMAELAAKASGASGDPEAFQRKMAELTAAAVGGDRESLRRRLALTAALAASGYRVVAENEKRGHILPERGRKASVPLYVMVEPEQMERYKAAANAANMSMRELVTTALDALLAQQSLDIAKQPTSDDESAQQNIASLNMRLRKMEKVVEALQSRVEREWGPEREPKAFVVCEHCSREFLSPIQVPRGASVHMSGNTATCPSCHRSTSIDDMYWR